MKKYKVTEELKKFVEEFYKGSDYYKKMYRDPVAMHELELYAENDGDLYRQSRLPIIKNIQRKLKSNKYKHELAPKLWGYYVENAAKKYAREFASSPAEWKNMFVKKDRDILAQKLADYYIDEIRIGAYD